MLKDFQDIIYNIGEKKINILYFISKCSNKNTTLYFYSLENININKVLRHSMLKILHAKNSLEEYLIKKTDKNSIINLTVYLNKYKGQKLVIENYKNLNCLHFYYANHNILIAESITINNCHKLNSLMFYSKTNQLYFKTVNLLKTLHTSYDKFFLIINKKNILSELQLFDITFNSENNNMLAILNNLKKLILYVCKNTKKLILPKYIHYLEIIDTKYIFTKALLNIKILKFFLSENTVLEDFETPSEYFPNIEYLHISDNNNYYKHFIFNKPLKNLKFLQIFMFNHSDYSIFDTDFYFPNIEQLKLSFDCNYKKHNLDLRCFKKLKTLKINNYKEFFNFSDSVKTLFIKLDNNDFVLQNIFENKILDTIHFCYCKNILLPKQLNVRILIFNNCTSKIIENIDSVNIISIINNSYLEVIRNLTNINLLKIINTDPYKNKTPIIKNCSIKEIMYLDSY